MGLEASGGASADVTAVQIASERSVDLSAHKSQRFGIKQIQRGDAIILFEPYQLRAVLNLQGAKYAGATLLGLWGAPKQTTISDPFGRSSVEFRECFDQIDQCVRNIEARIRRG